MRVPLLLAVALVGLPATTQANTTTTPPYSSTAPILNQTAARSFGYASHMRVLEGEYLAPEARTRAVKTSNAVGRQLTKHARAMGPLAGAGKRLGWLGLALTLLDIGKIALGDGGKQNVTVSPPVLGQGASAQPEGFDGAFTPLNTDTPEVEYYSQGGGWNPQNCIASSLLALAVCINDRTNTAYGVNTGRPLFGIMGDCTEGGRQCSVRRAAFFDGAGGFNPAVVQTTVNILERVDDYRAAWGHISCSSGMATTAPIACISGGNGKFLAAQDVATFQLPRLPNGQLMAGDPAVNPKLMADLLNKLWADAAAEPGYDGLPFSASKALTEAQMREIMAENPSQWPKVSNLEDAMCESCFGGRSDIGPVVITTDTTGTGTDTGSQGGTGTVNVNATVDLGPNPGTPFPELDDSTTFADIAAPMFNIFPGMGDLTVAPAPCPTDSVTVLDTVLVLDQHCPLIESNRALISLAMVAVWTMAAAVVLLRA